MLKVWPILLTFIYTSLAAPIFNQDEDFANDVLTKAVEILHKEAIDLPNGELEVTSWYGGHYTTRASNERLVIVDWKRPPMKMDHISPIWSGYTKMVLIYEEASLNDWHYTGQFFFLGFKDVITRPGKINYLLVENGFTNQGVSEHHQSLLSLMGGEENLIFDALSVDMTGYLNAHNAMEGNLLYLESRIQIMNIDSDNDFEIVEMVCEESVCGVNRDLSTIDTNRSCMVRVYDSVDEEKFELVSKKDL